jgi:hypothetical protein
MTFFHLQAVTVRENIQVVVLQVQIELSRQHDRADDLRGESNAGALELGAETSDRTARCAR